MIKPLQSRITIPALSLCLLFGAASKSAAITSTFTYTAPVPATVDYQNAANWSAGVPNAIDDSALFSSDIAAGTLAVNLNGAVVLGNLTIGDTNAATNGFYTIQNGTGGSLTFDVTAGNATLQKTIGTGSTDTISATVTLNDTLAVDVRSAGTITISGPIGGTGGLIRSGSVSGTPTAVTGGILALTNVNSYSGSTLIESGVLQATLNGDIALSTNSVLGNSATAIVIGNSAFLPAVQAANAQVLRLVAGSDATNYTIARAIDFSGITQASAGQATLSFQGDGLGGLNTNTLTIAGTVSLGARSSVVNVQALRAGQTINFTGDITGTGVGGTTGVSFGTSGGVPSVDGRASGTFRFSNLARNFTNTLTLNQGTILIDGVVGALNTASPIGQQAIALANGGGSGNIVGNSNFNANTGLNDTSLDTIRSVMLDTAGSSYARILAPGGGNSSIPAAGGYVSNVSVINGFQFGGRNTTGLTTFSGAINPGSPVVGASPTNVITVAVNMALVAANGGTTLFSGAITDGTTTNANTVTRVTINQFRNNPSIDGTTGVAATAGSDGVPDPATANVLVGTATTGTVVVSGTDIWDGTTEVLGGRFIITGSIAGNVVTVANGSTLGGGGGAVGVGTINAGIAASTVEVSGTLAPGGRVDPVTPANGAISDAGRLTSGKAVNFLTGSTFALELNGAAAGSQYDQLAISTGAGISITGTSNVTLSLGFAPLLNSTFIVIDNQTAAAIAGTFTNLANGGTISSGLFTFQANYAGGDGNDLVLTTIAVPEPGSVISLLGGLGLLLGFTRRRRRA